MRLVPCLILLPSFAAISSLSQNVGSSSRPLPILEPLATFRDRWNTNDCRDLLSADVGGWRKCCVPLNSAEQVPSNCRSPTALKAKLSDQEDFDEQDFTKGWTVPAVETERLTETPSDALTASYHEPPISTEKRTASAVPAVGSTTGALLTGDILSQAPPVPTMLTAQLTTSIDSGAVTDDGYRAEGGSVTSTAPAGQLIASQFDGSPTDTLTSHTASEEFQTVLHPGDNPPPSDDILTISSDVYRHRAQSAVNLGFWFVAEQYGTPEFFRGCATNDTAEYNIAEGCAKEYMEDFWSSYVSTSQLDARSS